MKKCFTTLLVILFVQQLSALTLYDQLCQFNPNWKNHQLQPSAREAIDFGSEQQYIQTHLTHVIQVLRNNAVSHLSKEQFKSRQYLIKILDQYRTEGKFPVNYYRHERIPVFIDEHNTHCAVAYLMRHTGNEGLARRISTADNYVWVKDIRTDGVSEWQQKSGFSMDELKLIQGAYDFYMPDAFILPNKYEIPQKPACMVAYFEKGKPNEPRNIWCRGEGKDGVLNGRWEQNYSAELPWIVGYYENGKRSGQWQEYYQGTNLLCRTENWRNDQLNGVRKRFDRNGNLIEEIVFKDGNAVVKINYDLSGSLKFIRKPLNSNLVWTEVFTLGGAMIASGHEKIHNPGNLLWFQNIELTALNSVSISARSANLSGSLNNLSGNAAPAALYNTPPLVEYKKEGNWVYYKEYSSEHSSLLSNTMGDMFRHNYPHFGSELDNSTRMFENMTLKSSFDSVLVSYSNNQIQHLYGNGGAGYTHLSVSYYEEAVQGTFFYRMNPFDEIERIEEQPLPIKSCGQYNQANQKIGVWKHFDQKGQLYKTENFIIPKNEYEDNPIGSR